jgi:hypothetical protein
MTLTSPLLTLWSTTLVPDPNNPANVNQLLSLLAGRYAGVPLADFVAVTGAVLLIFASNTAIIGGYHVFLALTRMGFLPRVVERHNSARHTPHVAVLVAVGPPVLLVYIAGQSPSTALFLGDLYAFGLLGAFILTNVSLDVIRRRELRVDRRLGMRLWFAVGVATTALTVIGWSVNLVAKPYATAFGGGLTLVGLVIGLWTYNRGRASRPSVFPLPYRPALAVESIASQFRRDPAYVLVILPREQSAAAAVIDEGTMAANGHSVVFIYRGQAAPGPAELWEVDDPYLKDYVAQDAFMRAELRARDHVPHRRYVYLPGSLPRDAIGRVWAELRPHETVLAKGEHDVLPPVTLDRVRHRVHDGVPVMHLVSSRLTHSGLAVAGS